MDPELGISKSWCTLLWAFDPKVSNSNRLLGSGPKSRHATKSHSSTGGTQENKSLTFVDYRFISTLLYENPVGTQDATTLCYPLQIRASTQYDDGRNI